MWQKRHIKSTGPWRTQTGRRAKSVESICHQDYYDKVSTLSANACNPLQNRVKAFYELPLIKEKRPDIYSYYHSISRVGSEAKIVSVFGRLYDDEDDMRVKQLGKGWSSTLSATGPLQKSQFHRSGDLRLQDLKK